MTYRLIKLDSLMAMDFAYVEGRDLAHIDERELQPALPKGWDTATLIDKIHSGEYALLTDHPAQSLLVQERKKFGKSEWQINPETKDTLPAGLLGAVTQRLSMMGQGSGSSEANNRGNLHSAIEPDYTPEPVIRARDSSHESTEPVAEYNLEITFSKDKPKHPVELSVTLYDTKNKMTKEDWQATPTRYGTRYTITTTNKKPHHLQIQAVHRAMGTSRKNVALVPIGSGKIGDAFIPVMPQVQLGERLAFATAGYVYHFKGTELVQKYQCLDDGTLSPLPDNKNTDAFRHASLYLLIYWKIAGQVVTDQHLLYRSESLTDDELNHLSSDWLDEQGVRLDPEAILAASEAAELPRDAYQKAAPKSNLIYHTVAENPATQQRETWPDIASQYGLSAKALLEQNPSYNANPSALKVGDVLTITQNEAEAPVEFERFETPPEAPSTYNSAQNSHYVSDKKRFTFAYGAPLLPLEQRKVKKGLPLVNVKPEHILRIGVFFDGTAQNNRNDAYKEEHGDKSRTNIARLFEAYPEKTGESAKIYVSGVGTVDGAWQTPQMIDEGKDESRLSGATGLYDDNGAFQKWQTLLDQLQQIIVDLIDKKRYQSITHFSFDVFGFSRGAALARHFVNALKMGLPDYTKHRSGKDTNRITPNLLGTTEGDKYNPNTGYQADTQRSASVRFLGLFDTVGSFYLPGNKDNGVFNLHINSADVGHALQICAHHEYRINFPLTSLKTRGQLAPNFYEEVFPGAHTDVGGGYPFVEQYNKTDLPKRYGIPIKSTYNRELIKTLSYQDQKEEYAYKGRLVDFDKWFYQEQLRHQTEWSTECKATYKQHGKVEQEDATLYFYRLQPIDASLAGLAQERMKQQAERFGVEWFEHEYRLPHDYEDNSAQKSLWNKLAARPIGKIAPQDWLTNLPDNCIHRSHDSVINPGCSDPIDSQVNGIANVKAFKRYQPNAPLNTPTREIYDNE
ncbi:MAG: phospholipase effector Tle1 domain-containing protein [Marinomonas sp.]|uniref:phospholipase effector Tle1 domain-containing protein n=1 Tax=Marinomonas sp. TaxID=1904862 RepID=UPI003F9507ED